MGQNCSLHRHSAGVEQCFSCGRSICARCLAFEELHPICPGCGVGRASRSRARLGLRIALACVVGTAGAWWVATAVGRHMVPGSAVGRSLEGGPRRDVLVYVDERADDDARGGTVTEVRVLEAKAARPADSPECLVPVRRRGAETLIEVELAERTATLLVTRGDRSRISSSFAREAELPLEKGYTDYVADDGPFLGHEMGRVRVEGFTVAGRTIHMATVRVCDGCLPPDVDGIFAYDLAQTARIKGDLQSGKAYFADCVAGTEVAEP